LQKEQQKKLLAKGDNMYDQVTLGLNVDPFILSALKEDITSEDVSTNSVMPHPQQGEVDLICKEDGIICGLQVFERTFTLLDSNTTVEFFVKDGDHVKAGELMGKVHGDIRVLLCGERTALNYLQRMSGIATYTHSVAGLLEGSKTKLLDTRKTTPGLRQLEKYAVRVGGAHNHRFSQSDAWMIKDNHKTFFGGLEKAWSYFQSMQTYYQNIIVEIHSLDELARAFDLGVKHVMLDNFSKDDLLKAVAMKKPGVTYEVSGGVKLETLKDFLIEGIDAISIGALTHSAPHVDLSMKIKPAGLK
jgi:nicotinate-nucleotide pyrophosphorylase (carboxylating)